MAESDGPDIDLTTTPSGFWVQIALPPVWVTALATVYHRRKDCDFLGEPKWPVTEQAAIERGLTACPECGP